MEVERQRFRREPFEIGVWLVNNLYKVVSVVCILGVSLCCRSAEVFVYDPEVVVVLQLDQA